MFISLKTEDQYSQFYHLALKRLKIEPNTSNQASVITKTTITTTSKQDTVISKTESSWIRGIFTHEALVLQAARTQGHYHYEDACKGGNQN